MTNLEQLFHQHGLRLTAPRRALYDVLANSHLPLDIGSLQKQIAAGDRTSLYRNLDCFVRLGVVEIIHHGWKKRYELAEPFAPHHHHLQCVSCGELIAIDTPRLESMISDLASTHGYTLASHHIELRGTCDRCDNSL